MRRRRSSSRACSANNGRQLRVDWNKGHVPCRSPHLETSRLEGSPLDALPLHRAHCSLPAPVPGLSPGSGAAAELHVDVAACRRRTACLGRTRNYRELLERERLPQHDLHHDESTRSPALCCRSGSGSRRRCFSIGRSGSRRGARGRHHSLGGALGRGRADLHVDVQRAIRRLQLMPSARRACRRATRTGSTIRHSPCRRYC